MFKEDHKQFIVDLVSDIANELVDDEQNITVKSHSDDHALVISIHARNGEAGKIIGKQGRTVSALRTVIHAMVAKDKHHITIEVVDESNREKRRKRTSSEYRPHGR